MSRSAPFTKREQVVLISILFLALWYDVCNNIAQALPV
jgi:hypothetical protein